MRQPPPIVLASASPRRLALLRELGIEPRVLPADCDELTLPGEPPAGAARRLALEKAETVAAQLDARQPALVVAADTVVAIDGLILGKPRDRSQATAMLGQLAGRAHVVHTGVALLELPGRNSAVAVSSSLVSFRSLDQDEIDWYADTGEGSDKAGAYALQGLGALFVSRVEGSPSGVIGLPLELLYATALELGYDLKRVGQPGGARAEAPPADGQPTGRARG